MPPLIDTLLLTESEPVSIYMWPEWGPGAKRGSLNDETFVFQYWPESISDDEQVRFQERDVLGASHPLVQWTGGGSRTISFTAQFTAEVDDTQVADTLNVATAGLLGSTKYTVDINGAIARIKSFMRGGYRENNLNQATSPPPRLRLVIPGTKIGGSSDSILTVLRSAPVTYEAWFPNGKPRSASMSLTFSEVIQLPTGDDEVSRIAYIGREAFKTTASNYKFRGSVDRARV